MVTVAPIASINYDPIGPAGNPRTTVNVFMRPEIVWGGSGRPWVIFQDGGGWNFSSGLPISFLSEDFTGIGRLLWLLYLRGIGVLCPGYPVNDLSIPGEGAFHPHRWVYTQAAGDHLSLPGNPINYQLLHAEQSAVHLVQLIRHNGLGLGLDQTVARNGWIGKSAGMHNGAFLAFARSRGFVDPPGPPAPISDRFRINTRLGWFMSYSSLAHWPAFAPGVTVRHFGNQNLTQSNDLDEAFGNTNTDHFGGQEYGDILGKVASPFWFGQASLQVRGLNAQMPVWIMNGPPVQVQPPYTWEGLKGQLDFNVNGHPAEATLMMQQMLLAADVEFNSSVHSTLSEFRINTSGETNAIAEEQYEWILGILGIQEMEPADERVLRELEAVLKGIKAPVGDDGGVYRTDVLTVVRSEVFAPAIIDMPGIMIHVVDTNEDHNQGPNIVEVEMRVLIDLWLEGIDNAHMRTSEFVADVKNALARNEQLNGTVWRCDWTRVERWMRSPEPAAGGGIYTGATIVLTTNFRQTRTDAYLLQN